MRRIVQKLIGVVLFIALLCGSTIIVYHSMSSAADWNGFVFEIMARQYVIFCVAAALFLTLLFYVLLGIRRRETDRYLTFAREGGSVNISLKGIAGFVTRVCEEVIPVKVLRTRIVAGQGQIDVVVEIRIKEAVEIHEISELLGRKVRDSLKESMGISEVRSLDVIVKDIATKRPSTAWEGQA